MLKVLMERAPELSAGQVISKHILDALSQSDLTTTQRAVVQKYNGSIYEPENAVATLEEVNGLLINEEIEGVIRILKTLPKAVEYVELPEGARPDDLDWILTESGVAHVKDKDGQLVPFFLNSGQKVVWKAYTDNPRVIILKARQRGISTMWVVIAVLRAIMHGYQTLGLVSLSRSSSEAIFDKAKIVLDHLPPWFISYHGLAVDVSNTSQLKFGNSSTLLISTTFRSQTLQLLHVSELSAMDYDKTQELKKGSLQAISVNSDNGVIIESTARGTKDLFANMWAKAVAKMSMFSPVFLSWVDDEDCRISAEQFPPELHIDEAYFEDALPKMIEAGVVDETFEFTDDMKRFYEVKRSEIGEDGGDLGQEYPSYPDEAFASTFEASVWGKQLIANSMNLSTEFGYVRNRKLFVAFDLGHHDATVAVFYQVLDDGVRIVHAVGTNQQPIQFFMDRIREYLQLNNITEAVRTVYLPHDGNSLHSGQTKTVSKQFREAGFRTKVLKKTTTKMQDLAVINNTLQYVKFNAGSRGVVELYDNLKAYSYSKVSGEIRKDTTEHKVESDWADAFRTALMSSEVRSKGYIEKLKRRNIQLSETAQLQADIQEAITGEKALILPNGEVYLGDPSFFNVAVADMDTFDKEVAHNTRNSTIADDGGGIEDGIDLGGGTTNWDYHNEQFTKENGGSFTPKEKDPYSKGWI